MSDTEFERWFDERVEAYVDGELPEADRLRLQKYAQENEHAAEQLRLARLVKKGLAEVPMPDCPPDVAPAVLAVARSESRRGRIERMRIFAHRAWPVVVRPSLAAGIVAALVGAFALMGRVSPGGRATSNQTSGTSATHTQAQAAGDARPGDVEADRAGVDTDRMTRDDVEHARAADVVPAPSSAERAPSAAADGRVPSPEDVERALNEVTWTLAFLSEIGRQTGLSIRQEIFDERVEQPINRRD